jgi:hybrid cluster-associated redox disulfide protein
MSFTKFVGTFLQATLFGGTYDDVAFEVRVLKGEVARVHERLDKELTRLQERLDAMDGGGSGGARGKSRLRIMSAAEAADVVDDGDLQAAPGPAQGRGTQPRPGKPSTDAGLQVEAASFRPDMPIAMAWTAHPDAPAVFAAHHLPGCIDCPLSAEETVSQGAALHSIDAAALLADLQRLATA